MRRQELVKITFPMGPGLSFRPFFGGIYLRDLHLQDHPQEVPTHLDPRGFGRLFQTNRTLRGFCLEVTS